MGVLQREASVLDAEAELVAPNDLPEMRRMLDGLNDRRLVVLGGDGTIHAVVQELHDAGRLHEVGPIGIIPLGTGNDLATFLGIPCEPERAARVVMTGRARNMELLVADDGEVTVNAVHVGIGATAAMKGVGVKDRMGKVGLGKLGYRIGAVAGFTEKGQRLLVIVDGAVVHDGEEPVLMVALASGATVGGGAPLVPDANPFDGLVDVVISLAVGPLARVAYARGLRDGSHVDRDDVLTARGKVVEIHAAPGESFIEDCDGEFAGPFTSRRWQMKSAAWQVITP